VAQGEGPEFKPQYCKKKEKEKRLGHLDVCNAINPWHSTGAPKPVQPGAAKMCSPRRCRVGAALFFHDPLKGPV
jgi:hypothetical protein